MPASEQTGSGSSLRRLLRIALRELCQTLLLFGLMLLCLWLLSGLLGTESSPGWRPGSLLAHLRTDVNGNPIWPRFRDAVGLSTLLIGGSLALAVPLATAVAWLAALYRPLRPLRLIVTLLSALPMVAAGAFLQQYSNHLLLPILVLAVTELTLGTMAAQVHTELVRELGAAYLDTARAKGVAPLRHYWKPLAAAVVSTIRPRIPYLLGATIVVEQIFTLPGYGLSNLVFSAVESRGDTAVLFWVTAFGLLLVRMMSLIERLVDGLLDPREAPDPPQRLPFWRWLVGAAPLRALGRLRHLPAVLRQSLAGLGRRSRELLATQLGLGPFAWAQVATGSVFSLATLALIGACWSDWRPHPLELDLQRKFSLPSWSEGRYLGRDHLGRDLLSTLLQAGRNMLGPVLRATLLPLLLGTALGTWVGWSRRGLLAWLAGALIDLLESLPKLILILAVMWAIDVDSGYLSQLLPAIGLTFTPMVFYAVRDRTRRITSEGFLEAQRALGSGPARVLGLHVLWYNCRGPVLVQGALVSGYVLMMDLTLGYLRYSQPDEDLMTWGNLALNGINEARAHSSGPWNPWVLYAPLLAVGLCTVTFALWGDLLRALFGSRDD